MSNVKVRNLVLGTGSQKALSEWIDFVGWAMRCSPRPLFLSFYEIEEATRKSPNNVAA